ncbi:MAG: hypothetical protein H7330_09615 [Hymenobacteraceae bacterium]|nr:hypothetical protein [Hymenobacteraceae bacterium]
MLCLLLAGGLADVAPVRAGAPQAAAPRPGGKKKKAPARRRRVSRRRSRSGVASRAAARRRHPRRYAYVKPRTYPPPDSAFRARYPDLPTDFQPAFMRPDRNRIETFGAGPDALRGFRTAVEKLGTSGQEQVRILHLGDSHLQADLLTGRARDAWQDVALGGLGSAGRGLVFPYPLAHTNNPGDYRVTYTGTWLPRRSAIPSHHTNWGVAGLAAATATAGATFTVQLKSATAARSPITRVRVFYTLDDPVSYRLELLDSANVATYAPDVVSGSTVWTLRQPVTAVAFRVRQTRPQQSRLILQGLSLENDQPGVRYDVAGGNGATIDSYLRCGRLRRQIAVLAPDLVVLSLGTNDVFGGTFDSVAFRRAYGTLLQLVQRAAPGASVLLTTPGDTFRNGRPNAARTATAARVIRGLAEETGCAFWDFFTVMGGPASIRDWTATGLAQRDLVHYTPRGYYLQGDLLTLALRTALRESAGPVAPLLLPADPK